MKETNIKFYSAVKMNKNSLLLENKLTGEQVLIHRRIFNIAMRNPELPLFKTEREWQGHRMFWLATLSTI